MLRNLAMAALSRRREDRIRRPSTPPKQKAGTQRTQCPHDPALGEYFPATPSTAVEAEKPWRWPRATPTFGRLRKPPGQRQMVLVTEPAGQRSPPLVGWLRRTEPVAVQTAPTVPGLAETHLTRAVLATAALRIDSRS